MKTPLLLLDRGDISVFASRQDLETYVESPDLADYLIFDGTGRLLELQSVVGQANSLVDAQLVRLVEVNGVPQPGLLRDSIKSLLGRLNVPTSDEDKLSDLIGILVETIGYTK